MNGEGQPFPLGATWEEDGWNFAVYSRHATGVTLLLYDEKEFAKPLAAPMLDPLRMSDFPIAAPARNLRVHL
jgi:glycogen operon protein